MPNPYFQFKQFTVYQRRCAMKVGTDGVLLGAWAEAEDAKTILDVGGGTGLISLMLAQRSNADAIAVDIDSGAAGEAAENFSRSPWKNRLKSENISIQEFAKTSALTFDLIVSNPPFFQNSLKTPDDRRNAARHSSELTHRELIFYSEKLLNQNGKICLILPTEAGQKCIEFSEKTGLFCTKKVFVHPAPDKAAKRLLLEFARRPCNCTCQAITIETGTPKHYSEQFISLVKDFYLKL
jgi:tRNA1Val (adenine37-N6)-methyltransferase